MAKLDYNYIHSLVDMARENDSNAFAELYAATYQTQYEYAWHYLGDTFLAQCAVQETYIKAFRGIATLRDPKLFTAWLNQINFRVCFGLENGRDIEHDSIRKDGPENEIINIGGTEFIIRQVLSLPFTEAQSVILYYYNDMSIAEIAKLMDMRRKAVRHAIASGEKRLMKLIGKGGGNR